MKMSIHSFIPAMSEGFGEVHSEGKRTSTSTTDTDQETAITTTTATISSDNRRRHHTSASTTTTTSSLSTFSAEETSNQIIFAFQRFIRAIAQEFEPLVMVIDDLQSADDASIDLLEALLMDGNNSQYSPFGPVPVRRSRQNPLLASPVRVLFSLAFRELFMLVRFLP
jgi:predicted ATPase